MSTYEQRQPFILQEFHEPNRFRKPDMQLLPPATFAITALALTFSSVAADEPLANVLKKKVSLVSERETLETALAALAAKAQAEQPGFDIKILANDLKFEGITRNQVIRNLSQEDKPIAEILTAIVMKGNPNVGVKDPTAPELQLIWIIGPDPDEPKRQVILITTRSAAKKRGDMLPKVFQKLK
jgi:eukaryotic-like serine/threonine-protein kinase